MKQFILGKYGPIWDSWFYISFGALAFGIYGMHEVSGQAWETQKRFTGLGFTLCWR